MNLSNVNVNTDIKDLESIDRILGYTIAYFCTPKEKGLIGEYLLFALAKKRQFVKVVIAKKLIEIPDSPIKKINNGTPNN